VKYLLSPSNTVHPPFVFTYSPAHPPWRPWLFGYWLCYFFHPSRLAECSVTFTIRNEAIFRVVSIITTFGCELPNIKSKPLFPSYKFLSMRMFFMRFKLIAISNVSRIITLSNPDKSRLHLFTPLLYIFLPQGTSFPSPPPLSFGTLGLFSLRSQGRLSDEVYLYSHAV